MNATPQGGSAKNKKNELTSRYRLLGFVFMTPAILLVLLATIIPLLWNIFLSFSEWSGRGAMNFIGFDNFASVFTDNATLRTVRNSIAISCTATLVAMTLGISLALMIYRVSSLEGSIFRFVFYSPAILPMTVIGLLFTFILATDEGLVNNFLNLLGLSSWTQAWLAKKGTILVVIGTVQGWRSSGTIMMLVFTAILGVPKSLFEASKMEGTTYWQDIRYIILPLVKSTVKLALSMMVMWAFKTYDIVWAMTRGGPGDLSKTTPIQIVEQAFTSNHYGFASALSLLFAALIISVILAVRKSMGSETYEY